MGIEIDVHVVIKDIVFMILDKVVKRNVSWNQHIHCFINLWLLFFQEAISTGLDFLYIKLNILM